MLKLICLPCGSIARALLLASVGATALSPSASLARSTGPFAEFAGEWRGTGSVIDANGKTERVKCKETNTVSDDNINMTQSLVCATDSYRFDFHTSVNSDGHSIRGTWQEISRDASGSVSGEIAGNVIEATIS